MIEECPGCGKEWSDGRRWCDHDRCDRSREHTKPLASYELRKLAWIKEHPNALPREYSAAMTRIARECGV